MKRVCLLTALFCMMMVSCKSDGSDGKHKGHEYVDLGLSVKWATCNVGATSPEDYGDYFAWGETETKSEYTEGNSATYGLSISELQSQGYIDSDGNLNPQYDAATANWGGDWRMPTYSEQEELLNNCTWTWTTRNFHGFRSLITMNQNGVKGYKVTGPNGNSIFLPAAGDRLESWLGNAGSGGSYGSSTLYDDDSDYEYDCYCFEYGLHFLRSDILRIGRGYRPYGQSVRPVVE